MLPIGTKIYHQGHGTGTIVAYNNMSNQYAKRLLEQRDVLQTIGTLAVETFYPKDKYPYVILFDNGYKDVYATSDVTPIN